MVKDYSIIKHRIVTEETQRLQAEENALVFAVDKKATKLEIKAAIQAIFSAKVKSVNTRNIQRKIRRVGRYEGFLPQYKKAIVHFDSSFDLGKITAAVANEEQQANEADAK
ncbi:MAG: 50S ribosomal protein L23 [Mollicutes bacterium]|nr:50S ribosomal protein L23 [Mollicutes bacterium]MDD7036451.1 50S ribosomal protein L23 [Mollicutes bacterium]